MEFNTKIYHERTYDYPVGNKYLGLLNSIKNLNVKKIIESIKDSICPIEKDIFCIESKKRNRFFQYIDLIKDKEINEITWDFLCDIVRKDAALGFHCSKTLYYLLDNDLYNGEYKKKLQSLKKAFNIGKTYKHGCFKSYFIKGDVKYLFYTDKIIRRKTIIIKINNPILWDIVADFCYKDYVRKISDMIVFYECFEESLEEYKESINNIYDFNYQTFIKQTNYYMKCDKPKGLLLLLNRFYIYLIQHPSGKGKNIFKESDEIEINVLKRDDFVDMTIDGFKFHYYNPMYSIPEDDKLILHINGFERSCTKVCSTITKAFDFTKIKSLFFRKLTKQYVWSELGTNFNSKYEQYNMLEKLLNYINDFKRQKDYPNPNICNINIYEAKIIKNHINNMEMSLWGKNTKLSSVRRFFKTQENNKAMTFDMMVFDYLIGFKCSRENNAEAIPDDGLVKINAVMKEHVNESYFNTLCYAIFHVCLQTEFRISQVCHLKVDCIVNTMKNNQFMIKTHSKTSNGQEYTAVISSLTKAHLDDVIKQSTDVRKKCPDKDVKDYMFLFKSQQNNYKSVDSQNFRSFLSKCCEEAGVKNYTANNLRDTHMTKAEEYRMRHNESETVLSVLSGHKRVDTTHNHYIEIELIKMLESTYGIIIGDVDINGEVVESIDDDNIQNKEHSVEEGCGYCKKDICDVLKYLSCLMCNYFITTIMHETQFKNFINHIETMISVAPTRHDKDDLVNIKRLYSAYLFKIWEKKGINLDEQSCC